MSANVFKKGAVWHYRFQVAGQRVQRSTRLRNRARAEAHAQAAYDAAVVRANGGQPVPTLDELAHDWIVVHRPVASPHHIRSVATCQRLHFYDLADKPIGDISTTDIETARNKHMEDHKPATANHWLRIIKLLTMWAVKRGILRALPWKVAMLKVQKRPRSILAIDVAMTWFEEVDRAAARSPGTSTAVRLMFGLGLREGEAAGARWEWVDWQRNTYTPGITKGREAEPIPMPAWLVEHLRPARRADGLIAPKQDGAEFAPGFSRKAMRRANAACEIKGITPHRLRGTFATLLSEAGVPVQSIQAVMRHKSPLTTMAYLEKNFSMAVQAQADIASKIGFARRESGAEQESKPTDACGS